MPMSTFPHSGSIVHIDDEDNFYFGREAEVNYVIAHNGAQEDPVLIVTLCDAPICFGTKVSKVTVTKGLEVSF